MQLPKMLTIIKHKTGKLFIPISLQNSPVSPNTDMIIVLRAADNLDIFSLDD